MCTRAPRTDFPPLEEPCSSVRPHPTPPPRPPHSAQYWEAVEQLRKFMLTSLVLLVFPESLVQLWYIDVVGLIFLILYLGAAPYRDAWPSKVQVAALVQLEFTYITATLFFNRQPDGSVGVGLVLSNCLIAVLLVVAVGRGVGEITAQLGELGLSFADDNSIVTLPPPNAGLGFDTHLYISHTWKHAQDQCGVIKSLMFTMLPSCTIRIADDDIEGKKNKQQLEEHVERASVFLVFLTIEYIGSPQCLRELKAAYQGGKPLIVVREADPHYGGLSASAFRAEVALYVARKGSWLSEEDNEAVRWLLDEHARSALEWHREKQFKYVVLKHIAETLYHHSTIMSAAQLGATVTRGGSVAGRGSVAEQGVAIAPAPTPRRLFIFNRKASTPSTENASQPDAQQDDPSAPPVRKMKIQDAVNVSGLDTESMVIYLSEHYKKLPATGYSGRQAEEEGRVLDPSEYHKEKEGGDLPVGPATLYEELKQGFEEHGVKVSSDGDAVYEADRRAIVLLVLAPGIFKCAELIDEMARYVKHQRDPHAPLAEMPSFPINMKKALIDKSKNQPSDVEEPMLSSVTEAKELEAQLEKFDVGAHVVFGMRSAKPQSSSEQRRPENETHSANLVKSPLGFGLHLDEQNKVVEIAADSQASRGGIQVGDEIVALNGEPLSTSATQALRDLAVGASADVSLRSAAAVDLSAVGLVDASGGHSYSVTLLKMSGAGFGLSYDDSNKVTAVTPGSRAAIDGRITAGDTIVSLNGVPLETEPDEAPADLEMRGRSFDIFARSKSVPSQGAGLSFAKAARQKLSISRAANNMRWLRRQKTLVPLFSTACTYEEYVRTCPPDLKQLGLFHLTFEKWPEVRPAPHAQLHSRTHLHLCMYVSVSPHLLATRTRGYLKPPVALRRPRRCSQLPRRSLW